MASILNFLRWVARKLGTGLLLAVIAMTIAMALIWAREQRFLDQERQIRVQELKVEQLRIEAALTATGTKLGTLRNAIQEQTVRERKLGKIITTLESMQDWWNFLFGNPEQNRRNREQLEKARVSLRNTQLMLEELTSKLDETRGAQVDLQARRAEVVHQLSHEEDSTGFYHYFRTSWARSKWVIIGILIAYYFGPTATKLLSFYGVGRWIGRRSPIVINREPRLLPEVRSEGTTLEIGLWPGDVAWLKERFLKSADEGLERGKRSVLSWMFPLSSLSSGLHGMIELSHRHAGDPVSVILADGAQAENEIGLVRVPEGGSIVIRPSTVVAVVKPQPEVLVAKRRWRLFQWQAWISGQFRFFEFQGPVRLVVSGGNGLKVEWLSPTDGVSVVSGRCSQEATIGFTPNMRLRPVRAERFWSYYRGRRPLFDDRFEGEGVFLCRDTTAPRRFRTRLWDAVLKAFGV